MIKRRALLEFRVEHTEKGFQVDALGETYCFESLIGLLEFIKDDFASAIQHRFEGEQK